MKVCLPEEVTFLEGEITHTTTKHFFLTNLTFYSICVVVYVECYIAVIRKMKIETKHSTTGEVLFTIETRRVTTLCVLPVGVAMGARGSGIHDIYFPGARGLGIHEVLSS